MSMPLPSFYEPSQVGQLYLEEAAVVAEAAKKYKEAHGIRDASEDSIKIAGFGIDCQVGFCVPGASLFVPGAVEDTQRTISWMYRNINKITNLFFSLDTHSVHQIFHPSWWVDQEGNHPAPLTPISKDDVKTGRWRTVQHQEASLEYVERLEQQGKYVLTIWPYHTLLGGLSHALVPSLMEAAMFHALVRGEETRFELKGREPLTENYSVLSPEVEELGGKRVGAFNQNFYDVLMAYDRVYVFGQAKSHCVLSTLDDLLTKIQSESPDLVGKIWILEDAMSPVPAPPLEPLPDALNFPAIADRAMERFASAGMHIVKTTDDIVL